MSCGPAAIGASRFDSLRGAIERVEQSGALACAPRELALARANYAFARLELEEGDALRAEQHLSIAEESVGAAQVLTPPARCAPTPAAASLAKVASAKEADSDQDSVPDSVDRCPNELEDKRPPLDADGCKALDRDGDGVSDADDACPDVAEDHDGVADEDGCPDPDEVPSASSHANDACSGGSVGTSSECSQTQYENVSISERELRLTGSIVFSGESANLRASSHALLDTVVQILRDHPSMTLEVAGHTDSRGDEAKNLQLSQLQAESVRKYLVEHGVDAARLTAHGYGETRPIESNSTSRGRAINRRVEFIRTDRAP